MNAEKGRESVAFPPLKNPAGMRTGPSKGGIGKPEASFSY